MAQSLPPCEVLVVGLGPTGAGLAALLAQRGVRVAVVERSTAPVGEPRAVHLDAETMRLLQLVGLSSEELIANTINSHGMEYVEPSGAVIFNFEPFERPAVLGWSQDRMFHQPWLDRRRQANSPRDRGLGPESRRRVPNLRHVVNKYEEASSSR